MTDQKMASGLKVRPEQQDSPRSKAILRSEGSVLHETCGQEDGVPKKCQNKRRRAREGPEPACVQTPGG